MMIVIDYTYNEFTALVDNEEVDRVLFAVRYSEELNKAEDVFGVGSFVDMPFGWVKDVQYEYASNNLTIASFINLLKQAKQIDIENESLFKIRKEMLYFAEQVKYINSAEQSLSSTQTVDEFAADSSAIAKLGAFVQFSELAGGDVTKIEDVKRVPYGICFAELKLRQETAEYRKRLMKRLNSKK